MVDRLLDSMNMQPSQFHLTPEMWRQMRAHAVERAPEEACGLIGGRVKSDIYSATEVIAVTNILHSPYRYRMDPEEQLRGFQRLDELELELIGIYHSHPKGPETPSVTDIDESFYPDCVYLIWSGLSPSWSCRGFLIQNQQYMEIPLEVLADDSETL
jgi:proteasome lid subunit RPN8/RPN11